MDDDFITRKDLEEWIRTEMASLDTEADREFVIERLRDEITSADVVPVRHGRWIDKPGGTYQRMQSWCSVCGKRSGIGGIESNRHKPYCPNCGAKMDSEA